MLIDGPRITLCSRCNAQFTPFSPYFPFTSSNLRSNYYPSPEEASQIHQSVHDARRELEKYDEEIGRVRETLKQLETERERLRHQISGNEGLLSTVRRLPPELLQTIFTLSAQSKGYSLLISRHGHVVHSPTFNISRTCSYWRHIAYSTTDIWRSISVDLAGLDSKRRLLSLVKKYLENSQQAPLILQITDDCFSPDDDQYMDIIGGTGFDIFKLLVQHSDRWAKVYLRFRQDMFRMLESGSFQLPQLEELSMHSIQLTTSIRAACSKTSTLRSLRMDGFTYYGVTFPYHTLQELVVGEIKACQLFIRLLPLCINLKSLRVDKFWATRDHGNLYSASPTLPITCPFLERLSLNIPFWERLSLLFTSVNFPALTEIDLSMLYSDRSGPWPSKEFIEMIKRSGCSLRRLNLHSCPLSSIYLRMLFELSPDLEELEFEEVEWMACFTPDLVTALTLPADADEEEEEFTPLLPKLTNLVLRGLKSEFEDIILLMVQSRRDERLLHRYGCARLEEFSLDSDLV